MNKEEIFSKIREITKKEENCGLSVLICIKNQENNLVLENMSITNELSDRIKIMVLEIIETMYLQEEYEYYDIRDVDEDRKKIFILEQDESYKPFDLQNIDLSNLPIFTEKKVSQVLGFLFSLNINSKRLYLYQQAYVGSRLAKDKTLRIFQKKDVFNIVEKEMLKIDRRGELLIIDNTILVKNIKVLQDYFGFERFARQQADFVIRRIDEIGLLNGIDKLVEYQSGPKLTMSKKLMKIKNSPVLKMKKDVIIAKVQELPRYQQIIVITDEGTIKADTKKEIDNIMKMLNDDYLKSELTEQEYDSVTKTILQD